MSSREGITTSTYLLTYFKSFNVQQKFGLVDYVAYVSLPNLVKIPEAHIVSAIQRSFSVWNFRPHGIETCRPSVTVPN